MFPLRVKSRAKLLGWYPDFQHKVFPENFDSNEVKKRDQIVEGMIEHCEQLVLSSESCYRNFKRFYPSAKIPVKVFALRFKYI